MSYYTLAELEHDLKQLEIEHDMMTSSERAANHRYYTSQKQFLTDSILDKQLSPTKNRLRAMIEPYKNRMKPSDWTGFQVKLTHCRSLAEIEALHDHWKQRFAFKLITQLPDLNIAA